MLSNFRRFFPKIPLESVRLRSTSNRRPILRTPLRSARNRASPAVRAVASDSRRVPAALVRPRPSPRVPLCPNTSGPAGVGVSPEPARPEFGSVVRRIGSTIIAVRRTRQSVSSSEPQAFVTTGRITDAMCARTPAAMADSSGLNMSEWLFGALSTPSGSVPRNM